MNGDLEHDIPNFDNAGMVAIKANADVSEEQNNDEANDLTCDPVDDDSDNPVHNIPPPVETPKYLRPSKLR